MSAAFGWFENGKARIRRSALFSLKWYKRSRTGKLILNLSRGKAILSRQSR